VNQKLLRELKLRRQAFFTFLGKKVKACFFTQGRPLLYFGGIREGNVLLRPGETELFCSTLSAPMAQPVGRPLTVVKEGTVAEKLARRIKPGWTLGYDGLTLSASELRELRRYLRGVRLRDIGQDLRRFAEEKTAWEIENLREACRITDQVARHVPRFLREGVTELELAERIVRELVRIGAHGLSFPPIVAFGAGGSEPHHAPRPERQLRRGELVLVDFGANYNECGADITRVYFFGRPPPNIRRAYRVVWEAQNLGLELLRQGKEGKEVQKEVSRFLDRAGFGPLIHGLGHGLGLLPSGFVNRPGTVITVEPGIYLSGKWGIRIEDDILVTKGGFEFLTGPAPEDLLWV